MGGARVLAGCLVAVGLAACAVTSPRYADSRRAAHDVVLPSPDTTGTMPLEQALATRESVREFRDLPLTETQIGQLLWAAQGVTREWGGRTAPSAGALYPVEVYAVLPDRVLHYLPAGHRAQEWTLPGAKAELYGAAEGQQAVARAPVVFVVTVVPDRTRAKYGGHAERYVDLEAGHVTQNLLLEATALRLGGVPIGSFSAGRVAAVLSLGVGEEPRYLVPVGVPAGANG